ncbi:MAG: DinB family protein [Flavobacteriaceae bacterium]
MNNFPNETLWRQFEASIGMLRKAIKICPPHIWESHLQFSCIAYRSLLWMDYYLTVNPEKFLPPHPFALTEFTSERSLQKCTYTQRQLLNYLLHNEEKACHLILCLNEELANARWVNDYQNYSVLEIILFNIRHIQHHAAELSMILRQEKQVAPKWETVALKAID